jgi:hypothetical protein
MADDDSQQRKPDLQSVLEDVKALATVLVMQLESVLGRRLYLRSPAVLAAIGVVATLILALVVVMVLLQAGGAKAVAGNAALIGALVALGGVFTAQMVSIALEAVRAREGRYLEAQRAGDDALQNYFAPIEARAKSASVEGFSEEYLMATKRSAWALRDVQESEESIINSCTTLLESLPSYSEARSLHSPDPTP